MKTRLALVGAVLLLALTGCSESVANAGDGRVGPAAESASPTPEATATTSPEPIVAKPVDGAEPNEAAFIEFVRGRLATFPSQIPDVTDEQLMAAAADACERIRGGESVEGMSVIEDEVPSEAGGYFYDSNAIIAGAQMHICQDTLR